jgi:hypothetical protein
MMSTSGASVAHGKAGLQPDESLPPGDDRCSHPRELGLSSGDLGTEASNPLHQRGAVGGIVRVVEVSNGGREMLRQPFGIGDAGTVLGCALHDLGGRGLLVCLSVQIREQ